jgi:hypothetical protein
MSADGLMLASTYCDSSWPEIPRVVAQSVKSVTVQRQEVRAAQFKWSLWADEVLHQFDNLIELA